MVTAFRVKSNKDMLFLWVVLNELLVECIEILEELKA